MELLTNLGLDSFTIGVLVGVLIGWNVLPQPEWIKPYIGWLTEKGAMLINLFKKPPTPPGPPAPPSANT